MLKLEKYRHGAISIEEIEKIVGPIKIKNQNSKNPSAPGMLTRHYAPKTQIQINDDIKWVCHFQNQ